MSRLLLDTSAYSALGRGHVAIGRACRAADEIVICPVVIGELRAGFRRGTRRAQNEQVLRRFLEAPRVRLVAIAEATATCYAQVWNALREAGTPISLNDVWIAASAMQHGLVVLTTDGHFARIPQVLAEVHAPQ